MDTEMDPSCFLRLIVIFSFFIRSANFFRWILVRVRYNEGNHGLGITKLLQVIHSTLENTFHLAPSAVPQQRLGFGEGDPQVPIQLGDHDCMVMKSCFFVVHHFN